MFRSNPKNSQTSMWLHHSRLVLVTTILLLTMTANVWSQVNNRNNSQQKKPAPKPTPKKQAKVEIPAPELVTLETKDGVLLRCTYFAAPQDKEAATGKQVVPFILVHDWERDRRDMLPFATYLQKIGCAVIAPDLRGHGGSTAIANSTKSLDYSKFRRNELATVIQDLERCKKYLVQRNNDGELNIDLLNIVAVGKSCVFAVDWTISDWSWQDQGSIKQGRDVKSVTLISPRKKLKNLAITPGLKSPLFSSRTPNNLPTIVVWGQGTESEKDSRSIYELMEKGRPDLEKVESEKVREMTTLFKGAVPERLTGTEIVQQNSQGVWKFVASVVSEKVASKRDDYRWQSRKRE